jgi:hypothetical protein
MPKTDLETSLFGVTGEISLADFCELGQHPWAALRASRLSQLGHSAKPTEGGKSAKSTGLAHHDSPSSPCIFDVLLRF